MNEVSDNAKAILLLTAPLIVSTKADPAKTLSLNEYNRFARMLQTLGGQPEDLLGPEVGAILSKLPSNFDPKRLESLLARGFQLGQALIEWQRRSIWVVSRADACYPKRLKSKLREHSPAVLYGCGNPALLEQGGLAVVGSRHVTDELKEYTENLGALAAQEGVSIVSGAARGIDSSAMGGALENGGAVVGVMADSLGKAALAKANREALREGKLVLISAYDPSAGFNVGHAMQRNKVIYALADAGLVVTSDFNKGGTWSGAIEQLEKWHFAPVFVRNGAECGQGNAALIQHGGKPWPEPKTGRELRSVMTEIFCSEPERVREEQLGLPMREEPGAYASRSEEKQKKVADDPAPAAERLMAVVSSILKDVLREPKKPEEVAAVLKVSKSQANAWLAELAKGGEVEKLSKPVRYQIANGSGSLL